MSEMQTAKTDTISHEQQAQTTGRQVLWYIPLLIFWLANVYFMQISGEVMAMSFSVCVSEVYVSLAVVVARLRSIRAKVVPNLGMKFLSRSSTSEKRLLWYEFAEMSCLNAAKNIWFYAAVECERKTVVACL